MKVSRLFSWACAPAATSIRPSHRTVRKGFGMRVLFLSCGFGPRPRVQSGTLILPLASSPRRDNVHLADIDAQLRPPTRPFLPATSVSPDRRHTPLKHSTGRRRRTTRTSWCSARITASMSL